MCFALTRERLHAQWNEFEPEELDWIAGSAANLIQALTDKYGISRDEAARQVNHYLKSALQHERGSEAPEASQNTASDATARSGKIGAPPA
jgi:hypothetical protein